MHAPPAINPNPTANAATTSRLRRLLQRADAYRAAGQSASAIASVEAALQIQPDRVASLLQLADLHLAAMRHGPARSATMKAVSGHLESPKVALQLMNALSALSESGMMVDIARQIPPPLWDSAKSLAELAQTLSQIGAHELALDFARAAVDRDPNHPPSLFVLATMQVFYGELEAAADLAERCLRIFPGEPGSHWLLSRLRLPDAGKRIDRIERELARSPQGEDEARLAYALHNELHDQREYERSWQALDRACRAKRATLSFDPEANAEIFEALREWRADETIPSSGYDEPGLTPIFIIGLHRSGTTLAERILSGHSQVSAGGETYDIRAQLRQASGLHFPNEIDVRVISARQGLDYRSIGQGYLRGVSWRANGAPYMTDKLPSNYYNVGFIARALPSARFIHLRRDPIDVGLSSLRTLFSHACPYSYDQLDYVAHYGQYRALMAHWHEQFPGRILDVDYAALVADPQASAEAMARFCGLDFEPAMIHIEARREAVSTASSVMMRDGIRRDRGRLWQAYERPLQPMIEGLAFLRSSDPARPRIDR